MQSQAERGVESAESSAEGVSYPPIPGMRARRGAKPDDYKFHLFFMDLGIEISQGLTRNETRRRVTRRARASTRDVVPSVARASGGVARQLPLQRRSHYVV